MPITTRGRRLAVLLTLVGVVALGASTGAATELSGTFSAVSGGEWTRAGSFTLFDNDLYGLIVDLDATLADCSGVDDAELQFRHPHPAGDTAAVTRITASGPLPYDLTSVGLVTIGATAAPVEGAASFTSDVLIGFRTPWSPGCDNANSSASGRFKIFGVMTSGRPVALPYSETVTRANMTTTLMPLTFAVAAGDRIRVHLELPTWSTFGMNPSGLPWLGYGLEQGPESLAFQTGLPYLRNSSTGPGGVFTLDAYYEATEDTVFHLVPAGMEGYSHTAPKGTSFPDELFRYTVSCLNCDQLSISPAAANPDGDTLSWLGIGTFQGPGLAAEFRNSGTSTVTVAAIPFSLVGLLPDERVRLYLDENCDGQDPVVVQELVLTDSSARFDGLNIAIPAGESRCLSLGYDPVVNACGCSSIEATLDVSGIDASFAGGPASLEGDDVVGLSITPPPAPTPIGALPVVGEPGDTLPVGVRLPSWVAASCADQRAAEFDLRETPVGGESASFPVGKRIVVPFDANREARTTLAVPPGVLGTYKVSVRVLEDADDTTVPCPASPDGPLEIEVVAVKDACQALANGDPCDDGDLCTTADTCWNGACTGGSPRDCGPTPPCREAWACNPATGACEGAAIPNGLDCTSDDLCATESTCQDGVCVAHGHLECVPPNGCYTRGGCLQETGECPPPQPLDDLTPCVQEGGDDGVCLCQERNEATGACTETECVPPGSVPDATADVPEGAADLPAVGDEGPAEDGAQPDVPADAPDTAGSQADTAGSQADAAGSQADTAGSQADAGGGGGDGGGSSCRASDRPGVPWPALLLLILLAARRRRARC